VRDEGEREREREIWGAVCAGMGAGVLILLEDIGDEAHV